MSEDTCVWPECDRAGDFSRGLCGRCYKRAVDAGTVHSFPRIGKRCQRCGVAFNVTSSMSKFCSAECRTANRRELLSAQRHAKLADRRCPRCDAAIPVEARADSKHCSTECQQAQWYNENDVRLRAAASEWKASNRELAQEANHRRRARKLGARHERVDMRLVWKRDGGICWICETPVDPDAGPRDRMRRSIDHVIPLARGGWHAMDNVALAHLRCNISKRDKILDRAPKWHSTGGDVGAVATQS